MTPKNICGGRGWVVSACPRLAHGRKSHAVAFAWALCVRVGVSACPRVPVVPVRVRALFSCIPLILKGCSRCSYCSRYKIGHLGVIQGVSLDNAMHKYYEKCNFSKSLILMTGTTGTFAQ